ncbi:hypothetical protein J6590_030926 [Homalodisca vitripennis]|nr:hypothetical protein J6590_030926 [Homalodisca vitripennis]
MSETPGFRGEKYDSANLPLPVNPNRVGTWGPASAWAIGGPRRAEIPLQIGHKANILDECNSSADPAGRAFLSPVEGKGKGSWFNNSEDEEYEAGRQL